MRVYNFQTQQWEELTSSEAESRVKEGTHTLPSDVEDFKMTTPDGKILDVSSKNVFESLKSGYHFADEEKARKEEAKLESIGNVTGTIQASLAGAARGATLGLSDQALVRSGLVTPEKLRELEEFYPVASFVSEIAPMVATGGAGLAAKSAVKGAAAISNVAKESAFKALGKKITTVPRAIETVGQVAGGLTTGALKKALPATKAGKFAADVASTAANVGAQGAIYGAGSLISDNAINEAKFSTDNLKRYTMEGMVTGALLGGGLTAGAKGLGIAADKSIEKLKSLFDNTEEELTRLVSISPIDKRTLRYAGAMKGYYKKNLGLNPEKIEDDANYIRALLHSNKSAGVLESESRLTKELSDSGIDTSKLSPESLKRLAKSEMSEFNPIIATKEGEFFSATDSFPEKILKEKFSEKGGEKFIPFPRGGVFHDIQKLQVKNDIIKNKYESIIGSTIDNMEEAINKLKEKGLVGEGGYVTADNVLDLFDRFANNVEFIKFAKEESAVKIFKESLEKHKSKNAGESPWLSVKDLYKIRRDYDYIVEDLKKIKKLPNGFSRFRWEIEELIDNQVAALESVSNIEKKSYENILKYYQNASEKEPSQFIKNAFPDYFKKIEKQREIVEKKFIDNIEISSFRDIANKSIEDYKIAKRIYHMSRRAEEIVDDMISRKASNNDFGLTSYIFGGAGATIGAVTTGGTLPAFIGLIGGLIARKIASEYGDNIMAYGLSEMAKRNINFSGSVGKALGDIFSEKNIKNAAKVINFYNIEQNKNYDEEYNNIIKQLDELDKNKTAYNTKINEIDIALQRYAPLMAQSFRSDVESLLQFVDNIRPKQDDNFFNPREVSKIEKYDFVNTFKSIMNPLIPLEQLSYGYYNDQGFKVLKNIYPNVYNLAKETLIDVLSDEKRQVPYRTRMAIQKGFGIAADNTLKASNIGLLQANFAGQEEQDQRQLRVSGINNKAPIQKMTEAQATINRRQV